MAASATFSYAPVRTPLKPAHIYTPSSSAFISNAMPLSSSTSTLTSSPAKRPLPAPLVLEDNQSSRDVFKTPTSSSSSSSNAKIPTHNESRIHLPLSEIQDTNAILNNSSVSGQSTARAQRPRLTRSQSPVKKSAFTEGRFSMEDEGPYTPSSTTPGATSFTGGSSTSIPTTGSGGAVAPAATSVGRVAKGKPTGGPPPPAALHKRVKSSSALALKGLADQVRGRGDVNASGSLTSPTKEMEKESHKTKDHLPTEAQSTKQEPSPQKAQKSKSSTNLATLLTSARPRLAKMGSANASNAPPSFSSSSSPSKNCKDRREKDKENRTPPGSAISMVPPVTPIWAQFASEKIPLNDSSDDNRYSDDMFRGSAATPAAATSENAQPVSPTKSRPRSTYGGIATKIQFADAVSELTSPQRAQREGKREEEKEKERERGRAAKGDGKERERGRSEVKARGEEKSEKSEKGLRARLRSKSRHREKADREVEGTKEKEKGRGDEDGEGDVKSRSGKRGSKMEQAVDGAKGPSSRVKDAIAAWDNKGKDHVSTSKDMPVIMDEEAIESAFENLLDAQNIAPDIRAKMRSLNSTIKADFVRKQAFGSASSTESLARQQNAGQPRPGTGKRGRNEETCVSPVKEEGEFKRGSREDSAEASTATTPGKKSRPRSLTFTFLKGDASPLKKKKSDRAISFGRPKSVDLGRPGSSGRSISSSSSGGGGLLSGMKSPKVAMPEDFIAYLQKERKPEVVEVGRLQKLRQLLRNETVSWVDTFILQGGMDEIIGLLYRIIEVEWREEHEDALLHETLLCLKALSTTSLALTNMTMVQDTLFPSLLALLFSEEKKGPSEFNTRSVIISLLFTHLSASPTAERAATILGYLQDAAPKGDAAPLEFIAEMHAPRPYRVWSKEVSNVTKEVFWIFLHHFNVIPYPPASTPVSTFSPSGGSANSTTTNTYTAAHFPPPRPPVPAAPYVGGVEWDATNYLAAHLDLLNALIACIPSREARNQLRAEMRDSGFEKVMGGTMRTCKEKFYGGVHAGLATWVGAAREDGWSVGLVREGPPRDGGGGGGSPRKARRLEEVPKLDLLRLDGEGAGAAGVGGGSGGWL
ncbi:hypothetical protein MMC25_006775 [Agyrium rufum]|nr:hypothetical protein [Agyrium rufum]